MCVVRDVVAAVRSVLWEQTNGGLARASLCLLTLVGGVGSAAAVEVGGNDEYVITRWTVNDGLPQIAVRALAQTPDGYLWLGTFRGLARFDGVRFTRYGVGNTPAMISDYIQSLHVDSAGLLWVGIFRSYPLILQDGAFQEAIPTSGAVADEIGAFANGAGGRLYGASNGQLVFLDGRRMVSRADAPWLPVEPVWATTADAQGAIWVSARGRLLRCLGDRTESFPASGEVPYFTSLQFDRSGRLWGGAPEGLCFWREGVFVRQPDFPRISVRGLTVARNGDVWAATAEGLYRVRQGVLRRFGKEDGLGHDGAMCVMEDRQGNIWVGSEEVGLHRLSERRVRAFPLGAHGLPVASMNAFAEDEAGRPVLATSKGLYVLKDPGFERFGPEPESGGRFEPSCILRHGDGSWWVGTYGQGLFVKRDNRWTRLSEPPLGPKEWINTAYQDVDGAVLVATEQHVLRVVRDQAELYLAGSPISLADILAIRRDRRGTLWLGSQRNGLIQVERENVRAWRRADGLGSDTIHDLLEDREGRLWIASNGGGLALWGEGRWRRWTTAEGLAGDVVLQLLEDAEGFLWIGTEQGISRVDPRELLDQAAGRTKRIHSLRLGRSDGTPSDQCEITSSPTGLRQRSGLLWVSTPDGPARIDTGRIRPEPIRPQVVIEHVRANESPLPLTGGRKRVEFPPGARRIEIQYTGLEFNAPDQIQFRYRLEGFDEEWVEAGTRRTAFYTRIPPGEYRLRVIAANRDNFWNETGVDLAVVVRPFLYETGIFRAAVGASALAILVLAIRHGAQRRLRHKLEQVERQRALERERTRIARDMHDNLGARLTELSLLSDLAQRDMPSDAPGSAHMTRVSRLIREVSKSLRDVVWAMDSKNDHLDQLVEHICQQAGQFVQPTGMRLRLEVPAETPAIPVNTETRHNLFLAFKEALNNAVKHSRATEIRVRIQIAAGRLLVEVADNGQGFSTAAGAGPGHGLNSMAHRMQELGGECDVNTQAGQGTRVSLRLSLPAQPK